MTKPTLPTKYSDLLELALEDLKKAESDTNYKVDMDWWHVPDESSGICTVCLAGAVMAGTLKVPATYAFDPHSFEDHIQYALSDLDQMRRGLFPDRYGYAFDEEHPLDREVTAYEEDRYKWYKDMRKFVRDLRVYENRRAVKI